MEQQNAAREIPQYSLGKILLIWVAAAAPMAILGWIVAPALARGSSNPGMVRLAALTVGLVWQFALVLIMLNREGVPLRWSSVRERLWLLPPSDSSGRTDKRLWWWIIPLVLVTAVYAMLLVGPIERLWVSLIPAFAEPASFSMAGLIDTPEAKAKLVGAWGFFLLFLVQAFFNTVVGEELLFRGLLLPRMNGAFGKWDWVANGLLFGFYHWHQPWGMLTSAIDGALLYAFPTKRFRSAWFGIIAHSGQSVFFAFLLLGLVLGLA
jgi:uncharacterized protein